MTTVNTARRAFLRGVREPLSARPRVPWAGADFFDRCTRCDDCIRACERAVLVRGDGGFPTLDFALGGCTFCGACVDACAQGALGRDGGPPWTLRAALVAGCLSLGGVTCRACGDACDLGAIRFELQPGGRARPGIDDSLCNGCGSCIATCPVQAIQMKEAV